MASLLHRVARFAVSPQGRRMIAKAKRLTSDPQARQQAKDAFDKLRDKGKGTPPPAAGT